MELRMAIWNVVPIVRTPEGAGAVVSRLMPTPHLRHLDPFVVFDDFSVQAPAGFPDHPHRGFEAVTWMLEGAFHHRDNLGNDSVVHAGGAQRFTAGRGLVHSEMPWGEQPARGIQLWINLPRALKGIEPDYQALDQAPCAIVDRVTMRHVVGHPGAIRLHTPVHWTDLSFDQPGAIDAPLPDPPSTVICYPLSGRFRIAGHEIEPGLALAGQQVESATIDCTAPGRILCISGVPHNEPIRQWGPYVD
ncbi:MAG: pirin family protein [Candidatus Dadabacteria bacterium]|nr:MAG: pirin family protein [Candidatus Dadabacteria bacterium]